MDMADILREVRFPYGVYYKVESDHISVIAVYHGKRDPAGWKSRS